jgi:hypothetical protein
MSHFSLLKGGESVPGGGLYLAKYTFPNLFAILEKIKSFGRIRK